MRFELLAALALLPLLAACGAEGGGKVQSASVKPSSANRHQPSRLPPLRQPQHMRPPAAHALVMPGLEGVIGATAADLNRQFGPARLEVWEGDARKLQFTGTACVLDVYLYPAAPGREPQASYVDSRRASDGKDVDRASCIAALRGSGPMPPPPMQQKRQ